MGTFIAGGTIFCGFFVICRGHLSGEGRYVFEYCKCHRYDIKYSMMKSLPVVGIFIKEIMFLVMFLMSCRGYDFSQGGTIL